MKIVINKCYGGFSLSKEAYDELGIPWDDYGYKYSHDYGKRAASELIAVIEKLGEKASGSCANLQVVEIPDNVEWTIEEYDGREWVSEVHQTWG